MKQRRAYLSYLLRLWQGSDGRDAHWRASLESPLTGERLGFSTIERMVAFLEDQLGSPEAPPTEGGTTQEMPDVPEYPSEPVP